MVLVHIVLYLYQECSGRILVVLQGKPISSQAVSRRRSFFSLYSDICVHEPISYIWSTKNLHTLDPRPRILVPCTRENPYTAIVQVLEIVHRGPENQFSLLKALLDGQRNLGGMSILGITRVTICLINLIRVLNRLTNSP